MKRTLSWDDACKQMFDILETLEEEDEMLILLEGQIGYVLDVYYKRKYHLELLLDMSRRIYEHGEKDRKKNPEDYLHEKDDDEEVKNELH